MNRFLSFVFLGALLGGTLAPQVFSQDTPKSDLVFAAQCAAESPRDCTVIESENTAKVTYLQDVRQGDTFAINILIRNEEEKSIVTVRSWLKYDPALLKAVNLSDEESDFPLAAPDGNKIDEATGQIQIGRGVAGGGLNASKLFVASVEFEVISPQKRSTEISFVNFQKDVLGETGVFTLNQETFQPENILERAPKALAVNLNGGSTPPPPSSGDGDGDVPNDGGTTPPASETPPPAARLARPEGLRIQATSDRINLVWQLSDDPQLRGYYVYYSENSGVYIRRRDVGKTNHVEFTDLIPNRKYYFAITAYDHGGRESDYSDEVFAVFGVAGSESHPYRLGIGGPAGQVLPDASTDLNGSGPREVFLIALGFLGIFFVGFSLIRLRLFRSLSRSLS